MCVCGLGWEASRGGGGTGRFELLAVVVFIPPLWLMPAGIVEQTFTAEGNLFDILFAAEIAVIRWRTQR